MCRRLHPKFCGLDKDTHQITKPCKHHQLKTCNNDGITFGKLWPSETSFRAPVGALWQCHKNIFHCDDVIDDVTGWPESCPLYSRLGEVGSGRELQGQCLVNKCEYHNCLFEIAGQRSTSQAYWVTSDLNNRNSVNLGVIKIKQKMKCKK